MCQRICEADANDREDRESFLVQKTTRTVDRKWWPFPIVLRLFKTRFAASKRRHDVARGEQSSLGEIAHPGYRVHNSRTAIKDWRPSAASPCWPTECVCQSILGLRVTRFGSHPDPRLQPAVASRLVKECFTDSGGLEDRQRGRDNEAPEVPRRTVLDRESFSGQPH